MDIQPSFMASASGAALPLEDVAVDARLHDLVAEVDLTQTYRNDEPTNIEAVYTFPLPLDAVLLELEVILGERVLRGAVVEKKAAEASYENAIADGDSAVMLEEAEPGLYTVSVGNVLPGERIKVRLRYGLALRWSGDTVRFAMPTTVAPRYGASPLAPHQAPETALAVENRFGLKVEIQGLLASARIACPTHKVTSRAEDEGVVIELAAERAVMDRDFVLTFDAQGGSRAFATFGLDHSLGFVVLASFQPRLGGLAAPQPRSLKLVVDCSGSMAGDSIAQAKRALASILDLLTPADWLNVIAFGSQAQALFANQVACTPANLAQARRFCAALDANLGGTEIGGALERAYRSRTAAELPEDVLLITDGEVGDWQPVVDRAVASRHRLFTVGVGASVAEPFVRALAERTGGACELVTPNEGMAERITRHFQRMSAPRSTAARITWPAGATEHWPRTLPYVFDGDTVYAWARFKGKPEGEVTFEVEAPGGRTFRQSLPITIGFFCLTPHVNGEDPAPCTVARLAAAMRLPELDAKRGVKEALAYQLVSRWTHCIVVAERAAGEKAAHLPELRKVKHTLAAGWGGVGSVAESLACDAFASGVFSADAVSCSMSTIYLPDSPPTSQDKRSTPPSEPAGRRRWYDYDIASGSVVRRLGARALELRALIEGLNAEPERIGLGLTVADLEAMGVPEDLLDRIRDNVAAGAVETNAVLHFLVKLAKTAAGDGLSREAKRAIRAAERAARAEGTATGGIFAALGIGGRR